MIESRDELSSFESAIPGADILVIRLLADVETIHERLESREVDTSLVWHKNRAVELNDQFEKREVADIQINTENKTIIDVAREVYSVWFKHRIKHSQL